MKSKLAIILLAVLIISSFTVYTTFAEEKRIPFWIKDTAKFWVEGSVSDQEFLNSIEWLLNNGIIKLKSSDSIQSEYGTFSNMECERDDLITRQVKLTGKYTNGNIAYSQVELDLILLDEKGVVIEVGSGVIWDIDAHQSKYFESSAFTDQNFVSCEIQIDYVRTD